MTDSNDAEIDRLRNLLSLALMALDAAAAADPGFAKAIRDLIRKELDE